MLDLIEPRADQLERGAHAALGLVVARDVGPGQLAAVGAEHGALADGLAQVDDLPGRARQRVVARLDHLQLAVVAVNQRRRGLLEDRVGHGCSPSFVVMNLTTEQGSRHLQPAAPTLAGDARAAAAQQDAPVALAMATHSSRVICTEAAPLLVRMSSTISTTVRSG